MAWSIHDLRSSSFATPPGPIKSHPFIGLPVRSNTPDMRLPERLLGPLGSEPNDELVAVNAATHVAAVKEEGDSAEHPLLGEALGVGQDAADAGCKCFVKGHPFYLQVASRSAPRAYVIPRARAILRS
jgi:hypothetical protein